LHHAEGRSATVVEISVSTQNPVVGAIAILQQLPIRSTHAVTCAIPGGKRPEQVADIGDASNLPPLSDTAIAGVKRIYDEKIRAAVQNRW